MAHFEKEPVSEGARIMSRTYSRRANKCAPRTSEYAKQCRACSTLGLINPRSFGDMSRSVAQRARPRNMVIHHTVLSAGQPSAAPWVSECPLSEIHFRLIVDI